MSGPCSIVIISWEKADLLALLCVVFSSVFIMSKYGILGQVWYLILLISNICSSLYFNN